jgi:hypothetical protein
MTRRQGRGPEDDTLGETDACSWEARWVREQARRLGLALDEGEVALRDEDDRHALRASLVRALAACWPEFSAAEVCRLNFLAYRRTTGRLQPPAPLGTAGTHLAAEAAAYLRKPPPLPPQPPHAPATSVPPLWRSWLDAERPRGSVHSPRDAFE